MSSDADPLAMLGTRWTEHARWDRKRLGFFRLRTELVALAPVRFLDWTIDGLLLRDRLAFPNGRACEDITFLTEGSHGDPFAIESLRALLRENTSGMDPWVQYDDGRAGVLFCPVCGGLECGAVSTDVHFTDTTVEWRSVAYQDGMTGQVGQYEVSAFTLRFDRRQYETTVRALLAEWSS